MSAISKAEQRIKDELTPVDVETEYNNLLSDIYGMVDVCGYPMSAASILYEMDNTAYRCGLNDFVDSECVDGKWYAQDGEYYLHSEADEIFNQEGA